MNPRSYLLVAALLGLASLPMRGADLPKTGLAGTTHDIAASGCKGCHAPHNGSTATGGTAGTGII